MALAEEPEETSLVEESQIIERNTRLSQSLIWQLQRNFFEQKGVNAWSQGIVPHYVTSNPYIAYSYVQVVKGFIRDCLQSPNFNPAQPIYIIELGAGCGRFAYHFLKQFFQDEADGILPLSNLSLSNLSLKYVMTDFTSNNLHFWKDHTQLQPYIAKDQLDFAWFDLEQDENIRLYRSGQVISGEACTNPVILIANYVFDSIPQDLFEVKEEQLYECLIGLTVAGEKPDLSDPELIGRLKVEYRSQEVTGDYYPHPGWNRLLSSYREGFQQTVFLFPVAGLRFLDHLKKLTQGDVMLLTADKGEIREQKLDHQPYPDLVRHGSFSLNVNYHALKQYTLNQGGTVFHNSFGHGSLNVAAFLFGRSGAAFSNTRAAYDGYVTRMGPDDRYTILKLLTGNARYVTLEQIMALLRMTYRDPKVVYELYEPLLNMLPEAPAPEKQAFYQELKSLWELYYRIPGEEEDLAFRLGTLLGVMGYFAEAIESLRHSREIWGNSSQTEYNIAINSLMLGDYENARRAAERCLELDPESEPGAALLGKIETLGRLAEKDTPPLPGEEKPCARLRQYSFINDKLETGEIRLQILQVQHAAELYRQAAPEIMELANLSGFDSVEAVKYWILRETVNPEKFPFAIIHPKQGFVGVISLTVSDGDGYFYFWVGQPFQNRGYGTTALCRLLELALNTLGLRDLFTGVFPRNGRSRHILEKLGFEVMENGEGMMRHYELCVELVAGKERLGVCARNTF